jgi:hypothetical protein
MNDLKKKERTSGKDSILYPGSWQLHRGELENSNKAMEKKNCGESLLSDKSRSYFLARLNVLMAEKE